MREIPKTMLAAAIDRFGGPEVLTIHELPVPSLGASEVLIALDTAGVGPWDAEIRRGELLPEGRVDFPLVLGTDGAGTIVAVGPNVAGLALGDRVFSYSWSNPKGGFYAEYVAVLDEKVGHAPQGLDLSLAGAIPTTGLTALQGIDKHLRVKEGQSVVIHGASGGVGTLAVQLAKLRGARVLATASGKDGQELVRELGADATVDARHGDIVKAAKHFAPNGLDAVLALASGKVLEHAVEMVRSGGRVAYPNGVEPEPKKRHGIEVIAYDAVSNRRELERLARAAEAAKLVVPLAAVHALAEAAKAHQRLAQGHVLGKIALRTRRA
ncbi:NADP-dependent oxidoreductase [Sorangium sp. So ce388]|uniref:NADP-dependent oxidoreductase n=1 Tax=Sorangium sp. So ce388 TaxID=3133309 RepID=UPI003F5CB4B3